jgi:hypothetical protein
MDKSAIAEYIMKTFPEVETTYAYGYDMFFYRSDRKLSFATLISSDFDYDHISNLDRPDVFRLNIGVSKPTFQSLFGADEVKVSNYDFTTLDEIMPHPEYAQYHFICVLSPSDKTFERLRPLLAEAYDIAARRYASQNRDTDN